MILYIYVPTIVACSVNIGIENNSSLFGTFKSTGKYTISSTGGFDHYVNKDDEKYGENEAGDQFCFPIYEFQENQEIKFTFKMTELDSGKDFANWNYRLNSFTSTRYSIDDNPFWVVSLPTVCSLFVLSVSLQDIQNTEPDVSQNTFTMLLVNEPDYLSSVKLLDDWNVEHIYQGSDFDMPAAGEFEGYYGHTTITEVYYERGIKFQFYPEEGYAVEKVTFIENDEYYTTSYGSQGYYSKQSDFIESLVVCIDMVEAEMVEWQLEECGSYMNQGAGDDISTYIQHFGTPTLYCYELSFIKTTNITCTIQQSSGRWDVIAYFGYRKEFDENSGEPLSYFYSVVGFNGEEAVLNCDEVVGQTNCYLFIRPKTYSDQYWGRINVTITNDIEEQPWETRYYSHGDIIKNNFKTDSYWLGSKTIHIHQFYVSQDIEMELGSKVDDGLWSLDTKGYLGNNNDVDETLGRPTDYTDFSDNDGDDYQPQFSKLFKKGTYYFFIRPVNEEESGYYSLYRTIISDRPEFFYWKNFQNENISKDEDFVIRASAWKGLTKNLGEIQKYLKDKNNSSQIELTEFTDVIQGQPFSADIYNEVVTSLKNINSSSKLIEGRRLNPIYADQLILIQNELNQIE